MKGFFSYKLLPELSVPNQIHHIIKSIKCKLITLCKDVFILNTESNVTQ